MSRISALLLLAVLGCQSSAGDGDPSLPEKPGKRQLDLAGKIFTAVQEIEKLGPEGESDAGLALAQVIVPGYAARLRLFVAEDHPGVAKGAAVALVGIRLLGKPDRAAVYAECVKTETIQAMRDECTKGQPRPTSGRNTIQGVADKLDSSDVELRRSGVRQLLAQPNGQLDEAVVGKLVHLLADPDPRVKVLTAGAFLRDSLIRNPVPPEAL